MKLLRIVLLAALLSGILALLDGCNRNHGSALLVVLWPENASTSTASASTDLRRMQSIVVSAYVHRSSPSNHNSSHQQQPGLDGSTCDRKYLASYIINRPAAGTVSRTLVEQIPTDAYGFIAVAYDSPDGKGTPVGRAVGLGRIVKNSTTTVTLTTTGIPGVVMSLWPQRPVIYPECEVDFSVVLTNTDGSYVFYPEHVMAWSVGYDMIATISPEGRASVVNVGETQITATDTRTKITASTQLKIVHHPPEVHLSASCVEVHRGDVVVLYWSSSGADQVVGQNFFTPLNALSGNTLVRPTETTTYTISAAGPGGSSSDSVTVYVRHHHHHHGKDDDDD